MEFATHYTEEQEGFRHEVRTWLEEHIPEEMREPLDPEDLTDEQYWWWREKHREIARKGWLYPTFPKEYGGGGLSPEYEAIIHEEFRRARVPALGGRPEGPGAGSRFEGFSNQFIFPALLVWATEAQKEKFLRPLLTGEKVAWQKFTEPHSGADLANYQGRAVRDGDDWVLTGTNVFCTGRGPAPEYLFGPMLTDPDAPRHRNLGFFMIPVPSEGLEIQEMELVNGSDQHFIFMDNVRVPGDHLIGGDHQGWQVANTSLEQEHGGRGEAIPVDGLVDSLLQYGREQRLRGESPGGDPVLQESAMAAYVEAQVHRLMTQRTSWKYSTRQDMNWEGVLSNLYGREYILRNVSRLRDVMGMHALLGPQDPEALLDGIQEYHQRGHIASSFGAGGLTITRVIVARRIGISRTQERAAPTPATATQYGG